MKKEIRNNAIWTIISLLFFPGFFAMLETSTKNGAACYWVMIGIFAVSSACSGRILYGMKKDRREKRWIANASACIITSATFVIASQFLTDACFIATMAAMPVAMMTGFASCLKVFNDSAEELSYLLKEKKATQHP